jgi:hypothetical protein
MLTSLKLASYAGIAAIALAVGQLPNSAASAQPQPKAPPAGATATDCQRALDQIREIRREISGIEKKLDRSQAAMNSATGQAKVDAIAKVVNEMADDRQAIRQKQTVEESLVEGHLMEHARTAKNFEDFQNGIRHCVLAAHLERVANGVEDEQGPAGAAPKK